MQQKIDFIMQPNIGRIFFKILILICYEKSMLLIQIFLVLYYNQQREAKVQLCFLKRLR